MDLVQISKSYDLELVAKAGFGGRMAAMRQGARDAFTPAPNDPYQLQRVGMRPMGNDAKGVRAGMRSMRYNQEYAMRNRELSRRTDDLVTRAAQVPYNRRGPVKVTNPYTGSDISMGGTGPRSRYANDAWDWDV